MVVQTIILVWATGYFFEILKYPRNTGILIRPVYVLLVVFYIVIAVMEFRGATESGAKASTPVGASDTVSAPNPIDSPDFFNASGSADNISRTAAGSGSASGSGSAAGSDSVDTVSLPESKTTILKKLSVSKGIRIPVIFALMFLYAQLLDGLGFIICTLLFVFGILYTVGVRDAIKLILIPVVLTTAVYLVFYTGIQVPLPVGLLRRFRL